MARPTTVMMVALMVAISLPSSLLSSDCSARPSTTLIVRPAFATAASKRKRGPAAGASRLI
jgi:hypothetical protein